MTAISLLTISIPIEENQRFHPEKEQSLNAIVTSGFIKNGIGRKAVP